MPLDQPEETEMTFLDHLEELRWHVIRIVIAIGVFSIAAFIFSRYIFDYVILAPVKPDFITYKWLCFLLNWATGSSEYCINEIPIKLQNLELGGQFAIDMKVSFFSGLLISLPYIFWEIWRFISPGLKENERKYTTFFVFVVSGLFFTGAAFGYYILLPLTINFLGNYQVSALVLNQIAISSIVSTTVTLVFATGITFELPILVYVLSKLGILSAAFLKAYRRHAIVLILFVAAVITPPDVISQIFVSIPLYILYEISILIATRVEQNNLKR